MKAIIYLQKADCKLIYNNISKVFKNEQHINVYCDENYTVTNELMLKKYNVSTTPYVHTFYGAEIIRAEE